MRRAAEQVRDFDRGGRSLARPLRRGAVMSDLSSALIPRHDRVREHTAPLVNDRIDAVTRASVDATLREGPAAIQYRLAELDMEWDIDRALMVNFAVAGGLSFSLGFGRYISASPLRARPKGFLYLFGTQMAFLLVHGLVGWCPPVSVFRRLGVRTKAEIEAERRVLLEGLQSRA